MEAPDAIVAMDSQYAGMSLGELAQKIAEVQSEITALENRQSDSLEEAVSGAQGEMEAINRRIEELNAELMGLPPSDEVAVRLVEDGLSSEQRAEVAQILLRRGDLERQRADLERQMADLERQRADLERRRGELISQRSEFIYNFHVMFTKLDPLELKLRQFDVESELAQCRLQTTRNNSDGNSTSRGSSSYAGSTGSDTVHISRFKTTFCNGTGSKFEVKKWIFEDHMMLDLLRRRFGNSFDESLTECVSKLKKLRDMFQWLKICMNRDIEEKHVQPIFILLLDYILEKLNLKGSLQVVKPGDSVLTGVLEMKRSSEGLAESKTLRGRTDLVVCKVERDSSEIDENFRPDEGVPIVNDWLFHVELKRPSSTKFYAARNRLLCQSEVIAQMTDGKSCILGCLTDFQRIILNVRVIGGTYGRVFFNSDCADTPQEYMIRLLFLFCELPQDELITLLAQNSEAAEQVESIGANQEIVSEGSEVNLRGDHTMNSTAKRFLEEVTKDMLPKNNAMQTYVSIDTDSDDDEDEYLEKLRFNEWDARRRGVMYLCKRNLDDVQERLVKKSLRPEKNS